MQEPSVIHQERTIIRTGRWLMAFGGACIIRLFVQLQPVSFPDQLQSLLFFANLAFGIFAILTGEGVTRKRSWALTASMIMGGLLVGVSTVAVAALVHFAIRDWGSSSLSVAIRLQGPWILMFVVVLTFWLIVLRTLLGVSTVLRDRGSRLPSRRALWAWSVAAFVLGSGLAGAMALDQFVARYAVWR